jgi:hypothetical protein
LAGGASNTSYTSIKNADDATVVEGSILSTSTSDYVFKSSDPITLIDGGKYEITEYVQFEGKSINFPGNKLVFTMTGAPTKFRQSIKLSPFVMADETAEYSYFYASNQLLSDDDLTGVTKQYKYAAILNTSNASGVATSVLVNRNINTAITSTVISMAGASITLIRSGFFSLASGTIDYAAAMKSESTTYFSTMYHAYIDVYVTNLIGTIGPFPIFMP